MKKTILCISATIIVLFLTTCKDFLEIEPLDRVSGAQLFSDVAGVKLFWQLSIIKCQWKISTLNPELVIIFIWMGEGKLRWRLVNIWSD